MEEKIKNEMALWQKYYDNGYENLAIQVMSDVLAYIPKEKRKEIIERVENSIDTLQQPIEATQMYDCIRGDLDYFDRVQEESKIAIRTFKWTLDIKKEEDSK